MGIREEVLKIINDDIDNSDIDKSNPHKFAIAVRCYLNNFHLHFEGFKTPSLYRSIVDELSEETDYKDTSLNESLFNYFLQKSLKIIIKDEEDITFEQIKTVYLEYFSLRDKLLPVLEEAYAKIKAGEVSFNMPGEIEINYRKDINSFAGFSLDEYKIAIELLKDKSSVIGRSVGRYNLSDILKDKSSVIRRSVGRYNLSDIAELIGYIIPESIRKQLKYITGRIVFIQHHILHSDKKREQVTKRYFSSLEIYSQLCLSQTRRQFYQTLDEVTAEVVGDVAHFRGLVDDFFRSKRLSEFISYQLDIYIAMREKGYTHEDLIL